MRLRCAAFVGLIALTACGSSSGRASQRSVTSAASGRCGPAAAQTLTADRVARVYESGANVYGCATAAGRSFLLGASARTIREGRAGPFALAGTDVAYGYTRYGVDTVAAQVIVRDLASGRQVRSEPPTSQPPRVEFAQSIEAIVVKADGAVAWVGESGSVMSRSRDVEVDRADRRGLARLDSGPGVEAGSLKLHGSTIRWRHGARERSAKLD